MAEITEMPKLSDTMTEGVIASWHKKVGDSVEAGELLCEIETDKATMDFESFFDGILLYRGGDEGEAVGLGSLLAIIGEKGEDISGILEEYKNKAGGKEEPAPEPAKAEVVAAPAAAPATAAAVVSAAPAVSTNGDGRMKASPLAKSMAKEKGFDLNLITGSGEGGRIIKRDIEAYETSGAAQQQAAPVRVAVGQESHRDEKLSQMRKTIARRLADSKFTAPHFYLTMEIDMAKTWESRKDLNAVSPVKISFNDIIVKAVAAALRQHPKVNASFLGDTVRYYDHVHIGVAVAVDEGLIVPVIRFADTLGLSQIATTTRELAGRARERKLQPEEWQGNTFTISNLGMYGIEEFTAIINPPDACILAVGGIQDKPVVRDGQIVPGKVMKVTLSCDHRVVDGAVGSEFLRTLKGYLENPIRILI